ncbi:MAG: PilZ domain-containing protein [Desulfuromonadales bacterium]|nr:PilZ domain-containing protein [Desulfuromonadales bacterium]
MQQYYEKVVRGTEREDTLVIVQHLKDKVGKRFSLLNYYREIPVSYDAKLLSVENEMAEFEVHEYQAKVIRIEKKTLMFAQSANGLLEDVCGEAFYVNSAKKRVILCNFGYARIQSNKRRFVRVRLDGGIQADLISEVDVLKGTVVDLSLGGAAITFMSTELLTPGSVHNLFLKLPDVSSGTITEVGMTATVVDVLGGETPHTCIFEFHTEKHSQQQIAYYINQRQVEIIKELKELKS